MFVHAGASLHGHELKREPSPSQLPMNRPVPLLRSALRPLSDTHTPTRHHNANKHARFSLPSNSPTDFASGRRSFTEPILASSSLPNSPATTDPPADFVSPSTLCLRPQFLRPASYSAVRFREPTPTMASRLSAAASVSTTPSEDDESVASSDVSEYTLDSSTRRRRLRREQKQVTQYRLAVPPPQRKTRPRSLIYFRPPVLLQLQRLDVKRGVPAFDVLPPSIASSSLLVPRLAQRLRAKPTLGPDDLVVVRSEDYKSDSPTDSNSARLESRDLMGIISPLPDLGEDVAEIVMGDGSVWTTSLQPNGAYEFKSIDRHGITSTARWAKSKGVTRRDSGTPTSTDFPVPDPRWTFSILSPSTKRHPIMGTLDPDNLVVYDTYRSLSASSSRHPPTRPFPVPGDATATNTSTSDERVHRVTPEEYKKLMIVTATWIKMRLQKGPASANPKRRNSMHCSADSTNSVAERRRTFPFTKDSDRSSPRPSLSIPRVCDGQAPARAPGCSQPDTPRRHMSSGAAYMRRRRMETDSLSEVKSVEEKLRDNGVQPVVRTKEPGSEEEGTATCRIKVRRLTQRLFHRKAVAAK